MIGDWEAVRQKLGVEGLRLEMPEHPHNSMKQFRTRMGICIFCDQPIFVVDGSIEEAEEAYYGRAEILIYKSKEAEQVLNTYGELRWLRMFLEFGIRYLSENSRPNVTEQCDRICFRTSPPESLYRSGLCPIDHLGTQEILGV